MDATSALYLGVATLCIVVVLLIAHAFGATPRALTIGSIGGFLILAGFYFFPAGQYEAYEATRHAFQLSGAANGILWYIVCTLAILVGAALIIIQRRST